MPLTCHHLSLRRGVRDGGGMVPLNLLLWSSISKPIYFLRKSACTNRPFSKPRFCIVWGYLVPLGDRTKFSLTLPRNTQAHDNWTPASHLSEQWLTDQCTSHLHKGWRGQGRSGRQLFTAAQLQSLKDRGTHPGHTNSIQNTGGQQKAEPTALRVPGSCWRGKLVSFRVD
jgi:hypothetical protein